MATSLLQIDSRPTKVSEPYVGLRPFERTERSIFFGRERDATFLVDKIFSAKLTLLYAPSGVGKSSILRTLVIPLLEDQHARVVYFDAWAGEDPSALLNATLTQLASKLGVPDPGRGEPTLTELVGLLTSVDERTVILILDQFEEFLVNHSNQLDPLRNELASLVRASGLDVRVVLSLRQEFLAALEPFRHEILNLFQSTYLLDSLDEKGVRDAIECPVALFGGKYDSKLVDQLVVDLCTEETQAQLPGATAPIDLPMMQLVGGQLWEAAQKQGQTTLTLSLYQGLGGAGRILDSYVRNVMPSCWSERLLTAKLMKGLAPSSGFKRPYSADELAEIESLDRDHVAAELERLSGHRILRTREFRGQKLFELQHDAFIRIIAPWRENVLRGAKTRRRTFLALGIVLAAVLVSWTGYQFLAKDRLEIRANSIGVMNDLRRMSPEDQAKVAESRFETVTTYLLKKRRYDLLKQLLEENQDLLPTSYGLHNVDEEQAAFDIQRSRSPSNRDQFFCFHYSSQRNLKETYFDREWQSLADSYFAAQWGVPVPARLQLKPEHAIPKLEVRLTNCANDEKEEVILDRTIPSYEDEVVVASSGLDPDGKEFLKRFGKEWHSVPGEVDNRLWVVPRWSRPVWKVSGSPAVDGSGLPAMLVAFDLRKNPEPLFANGGAAFLIDRVREEHPETVREAIAARGNRVDKDFAELVKRGRSLSDLVVILDELALYPDDSSQRVAEMVDSDLRTAQPSFPAHLRGPWKAIARQATMQFSGTNLNGEQANLRHPGSALGKVGTGNLPVKAGAPKSAVYQQVSAFLPLGGDPIQIYLGQTLKSAWVNDSEPSVRLGEVRDDLLRRAGVELNVPSPFNRRFGSESLALADFRIVSTAEYDPECNKTIKNSGAADALPRLISVVQHCAESHTIYWITSENVVQQRNAATPGFRSWLEANYSVTDQKLLMRAVLFRPVDSSSASLSSTQTGNLPPDYSLRYQDWLLPSLVFWAQVGDPRDTMKMAQYVRDTQRARLAPVAADSGNQEIVKLVTDGIRALEVGRISAAESSFAGAVRANRRAAIQEFLSRYPQALAPIQVEKFTRVCSNGSTPYLRYLDPPQKLDLEDFLVQNDKMLDPAQGRHFRLCLLKSYGFESHQKQVLLQTDLLQRYNNPDQWPAQEARWMGENILTGFDPYVDPPNLRQAAAALLISAVRENRIDRLSPQARHEILEEKLKALDQPGPKQWLWQFLDDLAKASPDVDMLVDYGGRLSVEEREECLRRALQTTDQIKAQTRKNPVARGNLAAVEWADLIRANALQRLSDLGIDERAAAEARDIYQRLRHSSTKEVRQYAEEQILEVQLDQGQYAEVLASLRDALHPTPDRSQLYFDELLAQLLAGDKNRAAEIAAEAARRADEADEDNRPAMLFTAALGALLTDSPNFEETSRRFLDTNHPYVPYIAMILAARMTQNSQAMQDAQSVLSERLPKPEKRHWSERLREGDETAWREMLIGYYLKQVTRDQIFGELEDKQRYASSDLRFVLSRQGELCEAYFYDALLAQAAGNQARKQADLQKVFDTQMGGYIEYDLAKFLLSQKDSSQ